MVVLYFIYLFLAICIAPWVFSLPTLCVLFSLTSIAMGFLDTGMLCHIYAMLCHIRYVVSYIRYAMSYTLCCVIYTLCCVIYMLCYVIYAMLCHIYPMLCHILTQLTIYCRWKCYMPEDLGEKQWPIHAVVALCIWTRGLYCAPRGCPIPEFSFRANL